jgi:hypothetical protein
LGRIIYFYLLIIHYQNKFKNKLKNIFLILIIALVIDAGCKQGTNSTTDSKTDSSKTSAKGLNMPDVGDLGTGNNSTLGTGGSWSKEYRNKFVQGCIGKASEQISAAEAFSYCNCMAEKVEAKYPSQAQVDESLTDSDIESMKPGCLTSSSTQSNTNNNQSNDNKAWPAADQQIFMDNCVPGASKSLGSGTATTYCTCIMNKLMAESPNPQQVDKISRERMSVLAKDCLR